MAFRHCNLIFRLISIPLKDCESRACLNLKPKSAWPKFHKGPVAVCTRHEHCKPSYNHLDSTNSRNWIYLHSRYCFFIWLIISLILSHLFLLSFLQSLQPETKQPFLQMSSFLSWHNFFSTLLYNLANLLIKPFWKILFLLTSVGVFICVLVVELNKHQIFSNMSPILSTITVFILIKHLMSVRRAFMTLKAKPLKVKFLVALNSKNFAFELTHFPYHRLFRFFYKDWASMSSNSSFPAFNYCGKNWSESDLHILINSWCLLGKIYVAIF